MASRKPVGMKSAKVKSLKTEKKSVNKAKTETAAKKQAAGSKTAGKKKVAGKKPINKATMKNKVRSNRMQASHSKANGKYDGPQIGQHVNDFSLTGTNGDVSLSAMQGRYVVLYFYPKDATPGCTMEGHDFSRLKSEFNEQGAEVFGISRDTLKSHEKFKDKQGYSVDLISDPDEVACRIFDVIQEKNMYGKMVEGIERSTFLIDPEGRLAAEWRKVSVPGHAEAVLEKLNEITSE